ncbi:hypothetical protein [Saccharopolyspora gloriosae]|nr:hypothetical protein [Saccharopolyspora gloriosae]
MRLLGLSCGQRDGSTEILLKAAMPTAGKRGRSGSASAAGTER